MWMWQDLFSSLFDRGSGGNIQSSPQYLCNMCGVFGGQTNFFFVSGFVKRIIDPRLLPPVRLQP